MPLKKYLIKKILYQEAKKCLIIKLKKKTPYQVFKKDVLSCLKKYLIKKNLKESEKGALSRNLNKSPQRCLIENLHKILCKKPRQESKKGVLSRNLIKNLKTANKASLSVY